MFRCLPHQVDMVTGHFSHFEVLWSTGACWENKMKKTSISFLLLGLFLDDLGVTDVSVPQ